MPATRMRSIARRIAKLEAALSPPSETEHWRGRRWRSRGPSPFTPDVRIGELRRLPPDYQGERHVVVAKRLPDQNGHKWVEFEELPGPAPSGPLQDDPRRHVCLNLILVGNEDPPVARHNIRPSPGSSKIGS